jgi:hypothetical protein
MGGGLSLLVLPHADVTIEWTLSLGELIVGLGTLLLALVTWKLARSTAASVEALDLPFVIASSDREGAFGLFAEDPERPDDSAVTWAVSVKLKNLGAGPAIVDGFEARGGKGDALLTDTDWNWDQPILPGEETINQAVGLKGEPPDEGEIIKARILYRSASGKRYATNHQFKVGKRLGLHRLTFERKKVKG